MITKIRVIWNSPQQIVQLGLIPLLIFFTVNIFTKYELSLQSVQRIYQTNTWSYGYTGLWRGGYELK